MNKQLIFVIARFAIAILMIVFGANKFLGFIEVPPPAGEDAQKFMGAMFTTYLFKLVAFTQILSGILLIIPKTSFIGILMLMPIMANILGFHFAHDMIGNGLWIIATVIFGIAAFGYKKHFSKLLITNSK